jgi:hypothetical protein
MTATLSDAAGQAGASGAAASGTSGTAAASGGVTATPGSPGAGSPVANISFSGSGFGHVDVGTFLRALAAGPKKGGKPVYLNPYFTSSQKNGEEGAQATVSFSATVDLSPAVYSGRFQAPGQKGTVTP